MANETVREETSDLHTALNRAAEPLFKRALEVREKSLGPDHPNVAISLNNLAVIYSNQGKHWEAELIHKRALKILEKALGPDHPNVESLSANLNNLRKKMR